MRNRNIQLKFIFNENISICPPWLFFGRVSISKTAHCIIVMCIYICLFFGLMVFRKEEVITIKGWVDFMRQGSPIFFLSWQQRICGRHAADRRKYTVPKSRSQSDKTPARIKNRCIERETRRRSSASVSHKESEGLFPSTYFLF